jgi:hypothetical protein
MTRVEKGRVHVILGSFIKGTAVFFAVDYSCDQSLTSSMEIVMASST